MEAPQTLYHHEELDYYECLGCFDLIEVPRCAVVQGGKERVPVKGNSLNRLLWLELKTIEHEKCHRYQDASKAAQHREFGLKPAALAMH